MTLPYNICYLYILCYLCILKKKTYQRPRRCELHRLGQLPVVRRYHPSFITTVSWSLFVVVVHGRQSSSSQKTCLVSKKRSKSWKKKNIQRPRRCNSHRLGQLPVATTRRSSLPRRGRCSWSESSSSYLSIVITCLVSNKNKQK